MNLHFFFKTHTPYSSLKTALAQRLLLGPRRRLHLVLGPLLAIHCLILQFLLLPLSFPSILSSSLPLTSTPSSQKALLRRLRHLYLSIACYTAKTAYRPSLSHSHYFFCSGLFPLFFPSSSHSPFLVNVALCSLPLPLYQWSFADSSAGTSGSSYKVRPSFPFLLLQWLVGGSFPLRLGSFRPSVLLYLYSGWKGPWRKRKEGTVEEKGSGKASFLLQVRVGEGKRELLCVLYQVQFGTRMCGSSPTGSKMRKGGRINVVGKGEPFSFFFARVPLLPFFSCWPPPPKGSCSSIANMRNLAGTHTRYTTHTYKYPPSSPPTTSSVALSTVPNEYCTVQYTVYLFFYVQSSCVDGLRPGGSALSGRMRKRWMVDSS